MTKEEGLAHESKVYLGANLIEDWSPVTND